MSEEKQSQNTMGEIGPTATADGNVGELAADHRLIGNTCIDEMITHMSFWGFERVDDDDVIALEHPYYPTVILVEMCGGVGFMVPGVADTGDLIEMECVYEWVSSINSRSVIMRYSCDAAGFLHGDAWLTPGYCKHCFSVFMQNFCRDLRMAIDEVCELME